MTAVSPLLDVQDLTVSLREGGGHGEVALVDRVSFTVAPGEAVALVGESGCGKSVTARALMRLLPDPPTRIAGGRVLFEGRDLAALPDREMRRLRGDRLAMVFQEPMTSLNPALTVGYQIAEAVRLHRPASRRQAEARALDLLRLVGVGAPERRLRQHPHELSGGLRQRVMIAIALACDPDLLIADEPTTALDVTVQAQILDLLASLRERLGMALLLITHDLGVVAEACERVLVMYAGRIVEAAGVAALFARPRHPYTAGLLAATPRLEPTAGRLPSIPGTVPPPGRRPPGCPFQDRCQRVLDRCRAEMPPLAPPADGGHPAACWNPVP